MRSGILSGEEIHQLANRYMYDTLENLEENRTAGIGVPQGPGEVQYRVAGNEDKAKMLRSALTYNLHEIVTEELVTYLDTAHGLEVDTESQEFRQLAREVIRKQIEVMRIENERLQGNYANGFDDRREVAPQVLTQVPPVVLASPTLSEVIDKYIKELRRTMKASASSISEYEASCRTFQNILGNKKITAVSRDDFRTYHETLKKLPAHMNKKKQYREKSISELISMAIPSDERLSDASIEKQLVRIGSFLTWAVQEGILDKNPSAGLGHVQHDNKRGYVPFDREDLQRMVQGFIRVAAEGELKDRPERLWLPLLGLFTGARVNELAQLHIEDVRQEPGTGIWYLRIEEDTADTGGDEKKVKKVKNAASNRAVPVHPVLLELGFLEYYKKLKASQAPRLWMNLNQAATGKYHKNFAHWFLVSPHGEGFKNLYISTDKKKVFHSFRKTFINELKQKLVPLPVIQDIVGHKHGSMAFDTYALPHQLSTMLDAMQKIDFGVDLSPLKVFLE